MALRKAFRTLLRSSRPSPPPLAFVPRVPNCTADTIDPLEAASLALFSVLAEPPHETKVQGFASQRLCRGDAAIASTDARLSEWQGAMKVNELCK